MRRRRVRERGKRRYRRRRWGEKMKGGGWFRKGGRVDIGEGEVVRK